MSPAEARKTDGPADLPESAYAELWRILEAEAERQQSDKQAAS